MPRYMEWMLIVLFIWTGIAALSVAIPQTWLLLRLLREGNPIAPYTLKTVGWTGPLGLLVLWRCAVFVDTFFFDQYYLGPIEQRWGWEFALAVLFALGVNYAAVLYHWTITFGRGRRGTTGILRSPKRRLSS